jgi:N-acetylated-alpha-linked acidic dipeptidase
MHCPNREFGYMLRSNRSIPFAFSTLISIAATAASAAEPTLTGFTSAGAAQQFTLEQRFDASLDAAEIGRWLQRLSAGANHVGAPHNRDNAEFLRQQFKDWGWQADIETFEVLYPTPRHVALELVEPTTFTAKLHEPAVAGDATSSRKDALPPYAVYGADGDVTAELVYVNQGMDDDYKELARRGVSVNGRIVIARYGGGWRGLKPKLAHEHGAIGCILYSDPHDDGYAEGDVYPDGGWRPPDGVQRGSVVDLTTYTGDPLTPGVASTRRAKRLPIAEAATLMKIPVLPISYADAQPLLAALRGPVAPDAWRGSLPITYHIGPGPARVHLTVESEWRNHTLYDVIARLPGSAEGDAWVVRGNHRDAWVFGAGDPLSGTVAMMAEAKAIGALHAAGWQPRRTIVFASWDGEEPGLLGSTEWVEAHADELQRQAVLYFNSDGNERGFLFAGGSAALQQFTNEVADNVTDPERGTTVAERARARLQVAALDQAAPETLKKLAKQAADSGQLPLAPLGSGSDFTPFLQHLGITTLTAAYGGEGDSDGVYHSRYDSYDHYSRFADPGFVYGVTEAQTAGRVVLRFANADVLPLQFGNFADSIDTYVQELHKLQDDKRTHADELAKLIDQHAFELAADPTRPVLAPEPEPAVPFINLAPLDNAVVRLKHSAKAYDDAYDRLARGDSTLSEAQRVALNATLQSMEATLTDARGLPGRPWYRHLVYAPGTMTGYGVKTLPGVREAIEQRRWNDADAYAEITAQALLRYCDRLDDATALLSTQAEKS